ncbi:hypothetical protein H2200_003694 [Cladophialophora chaetospira]|uniref:FAD-binding domain-containing protein n=1 Tax=Cladophialophora chaetospira TaxID=386627 RepID=A0AA38XFH2_9EURO|nr:hypothetical protein H2200_003694 [Cladophialophora chaetospira]
MHVLVVGGGIGDLSAAIAFRHHGFEVTVLEASSEFRSLGGVLGFTPNGTRLLDRWCLNLVQEMHEVACQADVFSMRHWEDGRVLAEEKLDLADIYGYRVLVGARASYHRLFLDHAIGLGAKVIFGARVVSFHDKGDAKPSVVTENGDKYDADVVVCFDGIKSLAREYILGCAAPPIPSGFSCYRGYVSGTTLAADPETAWLVDGDKGNFWLGDDCHVNGCSFLGGKDWYYIITRPTIEVLSEVTEGYFAPGRVEDVLDLVEGWDPRLVAALAKTEECLDWQICHRPRLSSWTSKRGRLIIAGDAAHPVSPTSGQGATQAIEDAAVIAYCLRQESINVALALKVVEAIRIGRAAAVYEMGEQQRNEWHRKDATGRECAKDKVGMKSKDFFPFDAEQDAAERFERFGAELKADS